ncbi:MAG: hypothetical protein ACP5KW_11935 [Thermoproteota archaeon]|jgi:hypothetical protein
MVKVHDIFESMENVSELKEHRKKPEEPLDAFVKGVEEFRNIWEGRKQKSKKPPKVAYSLRKV